MFHKRQNDVETKFTFKVVFNAIFVVFYFDCFIKFISENRDSHAYIGQPIKKIFQKMKVYFRQ